MASPRDVLQTALVGQEAAITLKTGEVLVGTVVSFDRETNAVLRDARIFSGTRAPARASELAIPAGSISSVRLSRAAAVSLSEAPR